MADYDNRNTFILFVNDKKGNDKAPDRSGTFTDAEGVEYYMDGWIKLGKNGPFLSGKVKPKDAAKTKPAAKAAPTLDEDLPF